MKRDEDLYSDESETEDSEEEEEEEEEPKLKYQRLGSSVLEILKHDAASQLQVHDKYLALGTHFGFLYILDFNGNEITHFANHTATINAISIDNLGEYVATCSDDGKVVINGLYSKECFEYTYHRPILSVALDPNYARAKQKQFCCGGRAGSLILNQKGFWRSKDKVIHRGEGAIHAVAWGGQLIAWANDIGVKIYDIESNQRITFIDKPKGPRPDLYRCNLCWESNNKLLVGWADSLKIAQVKERSESTAGKPKRYVEITAFFQTDYYICGVAPFGEYLVMLAYLKPEDISSEESSEEGGGGEAGLDFRSPPPELTIVTRKGEEISSDTLTIRKYENYNASDYRLVHLGQDWLFYVVSPRDVVVAKQRDLDDHVTWLLEHNKYPEAFEFAQKRERELRTHNIKDIGEKLLGHLIINGNVEEAAAKCPEIFQNDASLWEPWIFKFAEIRNLKEISPYIPIENPRLSDTVYEMVLNYFLRHDRERFIKTISEWPPKIYNVKNVIKVVRQQINDSSEGQEELMDALATLFTYDNQFDKTLHIYLRLKRAKAFELIEKHDLFHAVQDKVVLLLETNREKALELLVNNTERIRISQVVSQFKDDSRLLHEYLHALFRKDAHIASDFHKLQVALYAEYDRKMLLPFLKKSNYWPLEKSLKICEDRRLYPEMVYILGHMGNTEEALNLLLSKIGDIKQAIEFVQEQNDKDLWENLINYSMKKAEFISVLLENIGACEHVSPIDLIKRIPEGMKIEGLRDRLVKIISDYNLRMDLLEGCNKILTADCVNLLGRLDHSQQKAIKVSNFSRCPTCSGEIIESDKNEMGVVVFFCQHIYHKRCIQLATGTLGTTSIPSEGPSGAMASIGTGEEKLWCVICHNAAHKKNSTTALEMTSVRKRVTRGSARGSARSNTIVAH